MKRRCARNSGLSAMLRVSVNGVIEPPYYISRESLYTIIAEFPFSGDAKRRLILEPLGDGLAVLWTASISILSRPSRCEIAM